MKTLLRVIQTGDQKIRFETDLDVQKNPDLIPKLIEQFTLSMLTSLWGGNELSVLAIIRTLAIADLAVSVNRKQMLRFLDEESAMLAKTFEDSLKEMERNGGKVMRFVPGVTPSSFKN